MSFHFPETLRQVRGPFATQPGSGNNGCATLSILKRGRRVVLAIIASDGEGWEHVSVSVLRERRCPTWEEMCRVKDLFWDREDCVMQLHPPESEWVSCHPYTLHLWRPSSAGVAIPRPPLEMVGPKATGRQPS